MRISWIYDENGAPRLQPEPEEYDAFPPVDSLLLDALPARRDPDREALAAYLVFGRWASGEITLPAAPSPQLAGAIERDAHPVRVRPRDVESTPRALPRGESLVDVVFDLPDLTPSTSTLAVVPGTAARGMLQAADLLLVPSNAGVLDGIGAESLRARLGVAVLFAADIDADVLRLARGALTSEEHVRLAALLLSVNLELRVDVASAPA